MIVEYTTRIVDSGADAYRSSPTICLQKPKDTAALDRLYEQAMTKTNGYITQRLSLPHRPRTHGPKKTNPGDPGFQSNHLHGHLSQLAIHYGYTMQELKEIMKDDVPEWPVEQRRIGHRVKMRPVSEADVSIEVESKAIEWCHMIAGEEGVVLEEGD